MARRRIIHEEEEFHEAMPATAGWAAERSQIDERPLAAAIVTWVAIVVESLLLMRLLLRLFAANPANAFVMFVYDVTRPLVSPFFGALGVELNTAPGVLEGATMLAMLVYGILAYMLVSLINAVGRRRV